MVKESQRKCVLVRKSAVLCHSVRLSQPQTGQHSSRRSCVDLVFIFLWKCYTMLWKVKVGSILLVFCLFLLVFLRSNVISLFYIRIWINKQTLSTNQQLLQHTCDFYFGAFSLLFNNNLFFISNLRQSLKDTEKIKR